MIHITIMFLCDLGRATSHIQHLLKRASCLNTHSCSLMWFLSHCSILLKQLIVSVMTKYWIPWLSRKTHLKYTTKQQKTNETFKGRVEWVGQHNVLRTPCCSLRSRNKKRQINMCIYISLQPGYLYISETSVRFLNVCHPIKLKCDFSIINEFNSNWIKLHYLVLTCIALSSNAEMRRLARAFAARMPNFSLIKSAYQK